MKSISTIPLHHFDERPSRVEIDTLVIHSMYAQDCPDPYDITECFITLEAHKVSTHYIISREGNVVLCVPENKRAWHAGRSLMPFSEDTRENVNDFSIGIELIGSDTDGIERVQYEALADLTLDIAERHPIHAIVGHDQIAPGRKFDPGPLFDWAAYASLVGTRQFKFFTV